jgi:hypothetical protein
VIDMAKEKHIAQKTVHFEPLVATALKALSDHEQRTFSKIVNLIVKRDPTVQLFIQKIGGSVGNN